MAHLILRHKGKGARRRYLVLWKGYPLEEATWEPERHLDHAPEILEEVPAPSRQAGEVDPDQRKTSSMRDGPRRSSADQQTYTGMGDGVGCALNGG